MNNTPLTRLSAFRQSVWLDDLRRGMLGPGGLLDRLIEEDGLGGVTSNPAIFEKAINGSEDYDEAIRALWRRSMSAEELYDLLTVEDVARAADQLRQKYDETSGADGYVSIEVSPLLAADPLQSIAEGRRLWETIQRPNVMIKIPGTPGGLTAIGQLLREGVNVNVTLLFSVERYEELQTIYLSALEDRIRKRLPVDRLASIASFFLSRIDSLLDPRIERIIHEGGSRSLQAKDLLGMIGISSAKVAYQSFLEVQSGARWNALRQKGARPQRLLWASTSAKNPLYDDLHYVEPLIGPDTVTTLTMKTLEAYRAHGRPQARIADQLDHAIRRLDALPGIGISMEEAARELEEQGIRAFVEPYENSLSSLRRKASSALPPA
jgi:transaldolase